MATVQEIISILENERPEVQEEVISRFLQNKPKKLSRGVELDRIRREKFLATKINIPQEQANLFVTLTEVE
jgi:malate/lactate dehydrogenase